MELRKDVIYVATKTVTLGFTRKFEVEVGTRVRLDDITYSAVGIVVPPELPWSDIGAEYGGMLQSDFENAFEITAEDVHFEITAEDAHIEFPCEE